MKRVDGTTRLTATDLASFLACRRKTALDYAAACGRIHRPDQTDYVLDILRARGQAHEQRYVDLTRSRGLDIVDLSAPAGADRAQATAATLDAMRRGAGAIVQAALSSADGRWYGIADMLRRVEAPSAFGTWSYEALDTKLAQDTRGATMLQLSMYSELLGEAQGRAPEYFHVVTPIQEERYRVSDYSAYFRLMKAGLADEVGRLDALSDAADETLPYPEPVAHCGICAWAGPCTAQLRRDDHLSFVANSSRLQRNELAAHGIRTLAALGRDGLPTGFRPARGHLATYERLQHQARLQLAARELGAPGYETLPLQPGLGLGLLPEPSAGDIFLDLEGATWAREGGREYLFGVVTLRAAPEPRDLFSALADSSQPVYQSFVAFTDAEERVAFEQLVDLLIETFDRHPDMHIYHYAPYEPAALKRLMGRYASRAQELDRLLRAERFVDLYAVVRQSLRAGVEHYSIKNLEVFYEFAREVPLDTAGHCRRLVESALDFDTPDRITAAEFETVRGYNRDDCVSALRLRDWLEAVRERAIGEGGDIPRPATAAGKDPRKIGELEARALELRPRLLEELGADPAAWSDEERARWLLAYTVDWHTREMKASYWEYYRLRDLPDEDLADEPMAVVGLEFLRRVGEKLHKTTRRPTGTVIDRYSYAGGQDLEIGEGDELTLRDETDWGCVDAIDRVAHTIDVRKGRETADVHPSSAFSFFHVSTDSIQKSVLSFAEQVVADRLDPSVADCRRDLLLRRPPRLASMEFRPRAGEPAGDFAERIATSLDRTVLAIQGPPGTGKTYTGARMICALVRAGKKVGVLANSHKVIRNLLKGVRKEAERIGHSVRILHKVGDEMDDASGIGEETDPGKAIACVRNGLVDVLGGVAWTWTSDKAVDLVDVLFVDEAGQMSLANVLGAARAANSLVLLGDQQQLEQPHKASHPDGVSVSALDHVLGGSRTMPEGRGIFLPATRRLCPGIARFTSEAFYEGRLTGLPELANQRLDRIPPLDAGALWVLPVRHAGNQSYSNEEVEAIAALVGRLLEPPASYIDRAGASHAITADDVLIVTPYNAQVARLRRKFDAPELRIGTVDKFQGQEAPVVIYSMATSRPEDAPRGPEFLYSLNRLNVATSRAQCAVVIVASPALFAPLCATPRQMQLANALCLYRELAGEV